MNATVRQNSEGLFGKENECTPSRTTVRCFLTIQKTRDIGPGFAHNQGERQRERGRIKESWNHLSKIWSQIYAPSGGHTTLRRQG